MKWIRAHKRIIRIVYLAALVIAIGGPWAFDRVSVPLPLTCPPPNIRLDDTFCGLPLSLAWFLLFFGELFNIVKGLASGALPFANAVTQLRVILFSFILFFPVLSTAVLVLRGGGRLWQNLHSLGLGLAAGLSGLLAGMGYFTAGWVSWTLWGPWLYIGLTISMWALEILILRPAKKLVHEEQFNW